MECWKCCEGEYTASLPEGLYLGSCLPRFRSVFPDIVEEIEHDADGFVPYQPNVSLEIVFKV